MNKILKEKINSLDEKTFEDYKNSLKTIKKENDKNLGSETARLWSEIRKHKYEFNRKNKELEILESITLDDLKRYMKNNIVLSISSSI